MKFNSSFCKHAIFVVVMFMTISLFGMIVRTHRLGQAKSVNKEVITHLVPTELQTLKELGLCPLFVKKEATIDPEIMQDTKQIFQQAGLSEERVQEKIDEMLFPGRAYHVFEDGNFQEKQVNVNATVPCIVPLGTFGNWNRTLMQLKTLDQGDLEQNIGLPDGLCAGHSLNNACIMRDYAETGEVRYLKYLNDQNGAAEFLLNLKVKNWLDVQAVKENLLKLSFDIETANLSAISNAMLFDFNLTKNTNFEVFFDKNEFSSVQHTKKTIRKGLQQDYYVHVIIIGNEEVTQSHGHFFAFAIIKNLNEIQYVVLDTFPGGVYHLQEGSHERNRLMFLIQNIEQGFSTINLPNVRFSEYEQSLRELAEEGGIF